MRARALLALVAALHAGCAAYGPQLPPAPERASLGRIAVIAGTDVPEIRFEGFAHSKVEGAAQGAGITFLNCLGAMGPATCGGPYCGAFAVLWLGVCGVAGVVGGATGAAVAPSGESVRSADARLRAALDAKVIQQSLRQQIELAARAQGIEPARPGEADTLLEATLVRVGTEGAGINSPVELQMAVRVRLLRAVDREERYVAQVRYLGDRYTIADWSANEAARLLAGLTAGYAALAAQIADGAFLLYPYPDQQFSSGGLLASAFGLAPIDPQTRGTLTGDRLIGDRFEWTQVSSLRPTLRWQAFPRPADVAAAPSDMARVSQVTYDLVIARERNLAAGDVVYRRSGLPSPEHRLESALAPNARYFWTVRARFVLDGAAHVTGWSSTHYMARDSVTAPSRFSYRFRTP
jgi:hypothetical protein